MTFDTMENHKLMEMWLLYEKNEHFSNSSTAFLKTPTFTNFPHDFAGKGVFKRSRLSPTNVIYAVNYSCGCRPYTWL